MPQLTCVMLSEHTKCLLFWKAEECRGREQERGREGLESVRCTEANGLVDILWDTL